MEKSLIRPVSTGNIITGKRQGVRFKALVFTTLYSRTKAMNTTGLHLHLLLLLYPHHCIYHCTPLVKRGVQRKPLATREQRPLIYIISSERIVRPCHLQPRRS